MPDGVDWNATLEKSCSRVSRTNFVEQMSTENRDQRKIKLYATTFRMAALLRVIF